MSRALCRHCDAPLAFVRIETTGKAMPIDPYPDPDGNVYARHSTPGLLGHVATKGEQLPTGWRIYMPHFATCPATAGKPAPPTEPDPPATPDAQGELPLFDTTTNEGNTP